VKLAQLLPDYSGIKGFENFRFASATVGDVFTAALPLVFVFAGLALFVYLIYGGLHLMISGGDPAGIAEAKGKITNALVGFLIIFCSWWLIQILEIIFHLKIL